MEEKEGGSIRRGLRNNFLTGFFIVLPITITLWILWFFVSKIIAASLTLLPTETSLFAKAFWSISIILLSIFAIIMIGVTARNVFGKKILDLTEKILHRIPVVKWVYETAKKMSHTFFSQRLKVLQKVVLLEYPHAGIYQVGFVTSTIKNGIVGKSEEPHVSVFLPTAPNPTSGFLLMLPEADVMPLDISVEDAMRFVISVGAILPNSKIIKSE
ncbi:MAG: DUF502 domain-containing protein [Candidatus Omnitrophica bacterium]|nr:DUF502 domain-containing protein [Candidatus Omnitrophota bacterium]MBU1047598.1 DUF502 domain-containing protein [Candidatus Omnitrophota bacterium]MBU1631494.1 DUF502 domain-containing protein [Candidatus Omnitrophota bacterium]MBU1767197.1 DUF502 domain-containing protein [Candidatus Omnitrophota bacterium]MBU1888960.1 DUF502 domain-containing protein [Candidatus Omnitrophota bacterium]